jgi:signal transduction histidine kinase
VRAINSEGTATEPPASVDLLVITPVWRRWWSLLLMGTALAAAVYALHSWRVRDALELERVRTRIATDLHDDVGASLSQVAIMSEVASRHAEADRQTLQEIADTSRAVLQSMSEIVWTVDPRHDRIDDLVQRMRWFAGETLSPAGITLQLSCSEDAHKIRLSVDARRHVFLIFKECVNNTARHSGARHAKVALTMEQHEVRLLVEDDGRGFDAGQTSHGHGLRNMAERARALDGIFEVYSHPGEGTRLALRVPLGRQARRRGRKPPPFEPA